MRAKKQAATSKPRASSICTGGRLVTTTKEKFEMSPMPNNKYNNKYNNKILLLENIVSEKHLGLNCILEVLCVECEVTTSVSTGKTHVTKDNTKHSDANTKAVLGTVYSGKGCTTVNNLLTILNIPTISGDLYKRYEREIGPIIEEVASVLSWKSEL